MMRLRTIAMGAAFTLMSATPPLAECYADYRAKKDEPLRLHYGVIRVPDELCSADGAAQYIAERISSEGWTLLVVDSVFGSEGLQQRSEDAGQYYLRY